MLQRHEGATAYTAGCFRWRPISCVRLRTVSRLSAVSMRIALDFHLVDRLAVRQTAEQRQHAVGARLMRL